MEFDLKITGKTGVICIIGNPLEHSISPQLHNTISRLLGVDLVYVPFKVEQEELGSAVRGLKSLNVVGFNVTIPFKRQILEYIDEISQEAKSIGAVNTVKIAGKGLYGYNTDADGFSRSFYEEAGTGFEGKKVLIIGAGGTARTIAFRIAKEGAMDICIANRTVSKAFELAENIRCAFNARTEALSVDQIGIASDIREFDIIINTTSVGMYPKTDVSPIQEDVKLRTGQIVYDVIYNPLKTKLLSHAKKYGCKTINGLNMLLYQGIYAYELWTGLKVPQEVANTVKKMFFTCDFS